jgi:exopolysaccharide biosynthesis polyprenyl glycosylphosphotransferase
VDKDDAGEDFFGYPILGTVDDLVEICKSRTVDEVIFCIPKGFVVDIEEHLVELEELGTTVRVVLDFYEMPMCRTELSYFHDELPILTFHPKEFAVHQLFLKRTLDILGALFGLLILALLFPVIAIAIKLDSTGPVFFNQRRVGTNGRIFTCRKFRSMAVNAEARKPELIDSNEMNGALFKLRNDPRVTRVGAFLRKTSLDELPQFWNVLVGEMSLVGTRPPIPDEVEQYENWQRRRFSIKPGLTGLWQVSGRSQISNFDEVVRLDLAYIDNWSLWLDLKIILKTVYVVLTRRGSW